MNPYPGLRPFEIEENHLFFGREGQIEELLLKLERNHFVGVVGTSGSGKSSLVRAGLLPMLYGGFMAKAGSHWRIALFRPGKDPIRNMAAALVEPEKFEGEGVREEKDKRPDATDEDRVRISVTETILRRSAVGLLDYANGEGLAAQENLLVVVDQFEELFRFKEKSESKHPGDEASAFVKLLLEATRDKISRVYVVITMRSDFLGDCSQFRNLPEAINDGQYLIPRMTRDQLRQAIEAPAKVQGAQMTPRLVNRLLNDIGDDQDQLPILQHALMRTWDKRTAEGEHDKPIDLEHYEAIGGMAEALSIHADEAYAELKDECRKKIAEKIFKCLTETDPDNREIRHAATLGEICEVTEAKAEQVISVIDIFRGAGRTFLMPPPDVPLAKESLIDISHESLIRNWKLLKRWVEEEASSARQYRRIADAAELEARGESGLWEDPQLAFALKWRGDNRPNKAWGERYYPNFDAAMRFLDKSSASQEQELAREEQQKKRELERERELREKAQFLAESKQREAEKAEALAAEQQRVAELEKQRREQAQELANEQHKRAEAELHKAQSLARSARKLRWAVAALIVLFLAALGAAAIAWVQGNHAINAKRLALKNEDEARVAKEEAIINAGEALKAAERAKSAEEAAIKNENEARAQAAKALRSEKQTQAALTSLKEAKGKLEEQNKSLQAAYATLKTEKEKTLKANTRNSLNVDGLTSFEKGETRQAISTFEELLNTYADSEADKDISMDGKWWALHNLGAMYGKDEEYDTAAQKYNVAIRVLGETSGKRTRNLIATLRRQAQLYRESGDHLYGRGTRAETTGFQKARDTYQRLLDILAADQAYKKDDPRYEANVKVELGDTYVELQDYDNAKQVYNEAYGVFNSGDHKRNAPEIIRTLKKLSRTAALQEETDGIEKPLKEILRIREDELKLPPDHPDIAESYTDLAIFNQSYGKRELAETYDNLAKRIRDWNNRIQKDESFESDQIDEMAKAYIKIGKCQSAAALYRKGLDRVNEEYEGDGLKDNGSALLGTIRNVAQFYRDQLQNKEEAAKFFDEYVEKSKDEMFKDEADADWLEEIGKFYYEQRSYDKAEESFRLAFKSRDMALGSGDDRKQAIAAQVETLSNLALTYEAQGKQTETEKKYKEAIELAGQELEGDSNFALVPEVSLAKLYLKQGKDKEAGELFAKVEASFEKVVPEGSRDRAIYIDSIRGLARIEEGKGNPGQDKAVDYYKRAATVIGILGLNPTGRRAAGRYFDPSTGSLTSDYYNDLAEVLESWAKHLKGAEAAEKVRQAQEARQKVQEVKAQEVKAQEEKRKSASPCRSEGN
ncbi:MAG TPA: hypothetical protein VJZ26_04645 [Blastocatellia bacterium]|nr:hypothetical protein [Blastocatellia bacterium]